MCIYTHTHVYIKREHLHMYRWLYMPSSRSSTVPSVRDRPPHRVALGSSTMCTYLGLWEMQASLPRFPIFKKSDLSILPIICGTFGAG